MQQVAVASSGPRELGTAVGARRLGGLARLLALMAQEVAESRELTSVAAVLPAAGLGAALDHADVAALRSAGTGVHDSGNLVHQAGVLRERRWPAVVARRRVGGRVLHGHTIARTWGAELARAALGTISVIATYIACW